MEAKTCKKSWKSNVNLTFDRSNNWLFRSHAECLFMWNTTFSYIRKQNGKEMKQKHATPHKNSHLTLSFYLNNNTDYAGCDTECSLFVKDHIFSHQGQNGKQLKWQSAEIHKNDYALVKGRHNSQKGWPYTCTLNLILTVFIAVT